MSRVQLVAEAADESTHGVIAVAEALGHLLHRLLVDQGSTEDLVLAMPRIGGLEEERTIV